MRISWSILGLAERVGRAALYLAELVLQFAENKLASVHVDFVRRPPRRSLEIVGESGILRWEYDDGRVLHYAPAIRQWRLEEVDRRFERNLRG